MNKMQQQVHEFHQKYEVDSGKEPRPVPPELVELRIKLLEEEFIKELIPALRSGDIIETYDAAVDILYVTIGILDIMGLDAEPGFDEVQRSNMTKEGVSRGMELDGYPKGKIMKGPNYSPPDLKTIVENLVAQSEMVQSFDIDGGFKIDAVKVTSNNFKQVASWMGTSVVVEVPYSSWTEYHVNLPDGRSYYYGDGEWVIKEIVDDKTVFHIRTDRGLNELIKTGN